MIRFLSILYILLPVALFAQRKLIVDQGGKGDAASIQGALNMIKSSEKNIVILIKKGTYTEKLYIEKPGVTLEGEDMASTIITASISRDEWRCTMKDDWGVATVNVGASDFTLKNLTIVNSYGYDHKKDTSIVCPNDSGNLKRIPANGHQMAVRVMNMATRMKAINCHFKSLGGDTVSPWEVTDGMWYFKDCVMEGAVDLYCPRGWAWAENCLFIAHSGTAILWHDGSGNKDSKTVLKNCRFKGYDNFLLGRYHREAQFYLLDCVFPQNMRDSAIYNVPANKLNWGHRVYYADCRKEGGRPYQWYQNNLPADIQKEMISPNWVFGTRWDPVKNEVCN